MRCIVIGCTSDSRWSNKIPDSEELSFHRFPKCPKVREEWIKAVKRINWEPTEHCRVCSLHFVEDDFVKAKRSVKKLVEKSRKGGKKLKADAIPSILDDNVHQPINESNMFRDLQLAKKQSAKRLKKVKALREKNRRAEKKIAALMEIITALKNRNQTEPEDVPILNNVNLIKQEDVPIFNNRNQIKQEDDSICDEMENKDLLELQDEIQIDYPIKIKVEHYEA